MRVVRLKRDWRINLKDSEYEMLREAVKQGLVAIKAFGLQGRLPYKIRKVRDNARWTLPHDPLAPDEDRRTPPRKVRKAGAPIPALPE